MSNEDSKFWNYFGKLSAVLAAVGTIVGLWLTLSKSKEDIEVHVRTFPYMLSPVIEQSIENNLRGFEFSELQSSLKETFEEVIPEEILKEKGIDLVESISQLNSESWGDIDRFNFRRTDGLSFIVISNTGSLSATDVKLDVPEDGIAQVINADGTVNVTQFTKVIDIGEVRAGTKINIRIWTENRISEYEMREINVTHSSGKGSVEWPRTTNRFGQFIGEYYFVLLPLLFVVFFLGGIASNSEDKNDEEKEKEEKSA